MKREEIVRQLADSIKTASVAIDRLITDDWVAPGTSKSLPCGQFKIPTYACL
jgi:hypothetical protein